MEALTLCLLFWQLSEEISANFEAFFADHGLSRSSYGVLSVLKEKHPLTPAELTDSLGITKSSMTGILETLLKRGFVVRTQSTHDRRSVDIHISKKGAAFVEELVPKHLERMQAIFAGLDARDRLNARRTFSKVQLSVGRSRARRRAERRPT